MNEQELRIFCLEKAIEILSWRKNFLRQEHNPIELAQLLYVYITEGQVSEFSLPGTRKNHV